MTHPDDTAGAPALRMGLHAVDLPCPRCGVILDAYLGLSAVLTTPSDGTTPSLRVKARSKAVDHDCRHGAQLTVAQVLRACAGVVVHVDVDDAQ